MAKRATIRDVAKRSGFSTTAVSNALNKKDARIPEGTRKKILTAARELHYAPNALIRAMHTGRTRVIGLFMVLSSTGTRQFLSSLLIGLQRAAAQYGYDLLLHCHHGGVEDDEDASRFLDGRIDGLFYWGARRHEFIDGLIEHDFPVVGLFSPLGKRGAARIWCDETPGLRAALEHLVDLGHTDVHVPPYRYESPAVQLRSQALDALREELPIRIHQSEPFDDPAAHVAWIEQLLTSPDPPTALIPGGTQSGYQALAIAQETGLSIPKDVSIVCHEGLDAEDDYGIASMRIPVNDLCQNAVELMLDMVEGRKRESYEISLPSEFIPGRTTAPPRAGVL